MKLGFFTMPIHPVGRNYTQTLKEDRAAQCIRQDEMSNEELKLQDLIL